MSERLTRKDIKRDIREDEVAVFINRVFDWIAKNQRLLIIGAISLVAALVLVLIGSAVLENRREAAVDALAEAMETWNTPVAGDSATADGTTPPADADTFPSQEARRAAAKEELSAVRDKVASGAAGDVAGLFLADIAVAEGEPEKARELWRGFADQHEGHMLAVVARLNLISLERQQGNGEALVEELKEELESGRRSLPEDMLLYELARTLEAVDRNDEARAYYQQIVDEHASSPFVAEARQRTADATA